MVDSIELVRQFLLAEGNALVTFLGGNYVSVGELPAGFTNEHKAVVLVQENRNGHATGSDHRLFVVATCYGGSAAHSEARAVAGAVADRMYLPGNVDFQEEGSIMNAYNLGDFQGPPDPDQGWPTHIIRFQVYTKGA